MRNLFGKGESEENQCYRESVYDSVFLNRFITSIQPGVPISSVKVFVQEVTYRRVERRPKA